MKLRSLTFILVIAITAASTSAQQSAELTTVCDIVNHPSQFIGKTVQVRAQIWRDVDYRGKFWLNETSIQLGKVCQFLPALFDGPADLSVGQTGFATFRGQLVRLSAIHQSQIFSPQGRGSRITLIIEHQSDPHSEGGVRTGPIPLLQLYDQQTASFIRPQE